MFTTKENIENYASTFFDAIKEDTTEEEFREWIKWELEHPNKSGDSEIDEMDQLFLQSHFEEIIEQLIKDQKYKFDRDIKR